MSNIKITLNYYGVVTESSKKIGEVITKGISYMLKEEVYDEFRYFDLREYVKEKYFKEEWEIKRIKNKIIIELEEFEIKYSGVYELDGNKYSGELSNYDLEKKEEKEILINDTKIKIPITFKNILNFKNVKYAEERNKMNLITEKEHMISYIYKFIKLEREEKLKSMKGAKTGIDVLAGTASNISAYNAKNMFDYIKLNRKQKKAIKAIVGLISFCKNPTKAGFKIFWKKTKRFWKKIGIYKRVTFGGVEGIKKTFLGLSEEDVVNGLRRFNVLTEKEAKEVLKASEDLKASKKDLDEEVDFAKDTFKDIKPLRDNEFSYTDELEGLRIETKVSVSQYITTSVFLLENKLFIEEGKEILSRLEPIYKNQNFRNSFHFVRFLIGEMFLMGSGIFKHFGKSGENIAEATKNIAKEAEKVTKDKKSIFVGSNLLELYMIYLLIKGLFAEDFSNLRPYFGDFKNIDKILEDIKLEFNYSMSDGVEINKTYNPFENIEKEKILKMLKNSVYNYITLWLPAFAEMKILVEEGEGVFAGKDIIKQSEVFLGLVERNEEINKITAGIIYGCKAVMTIASTAYLAFTLGAFAVSVFTAGASVVATGPATIIYGLVLFASWLVLINAHDFARGIVINGNIFSELPLLKYLSSQKVKITFDPFLKVIERSRGGEGLVKYLNDVVEEVGSGRVLDMDSYNRETPAEADTKVLGVVCNFDFFENNYCQCESIEEFIIFPSEEDFENKLKEKVEKLKEQSYEEIDNEVQILSQGSAISIATAEDLENVTVVEGEEYNEEYISNGQYKSYIDNFTKEKDYYLVYTKGKILNLENENCWKGLLPNRQEREFLTINIKTLDTLKEVIESIKEREKIYKKYIFDIFSSSIELDTSFVKVYFKDERTHGLYDDICLEFGILIENDISKKIIVKTDNEEYLLLPINKEYFLKTINTHGNLSFDFVKDVFQNSHNSKLVDEKLVGSLNNEEDFDYVLIPYKVVSDINRDTDVIDKNKKMSKKLIKKIGTSILAIQGSYKLSEEDYLNYYEDPNYFDSTNEEFTKIEFSVAQAVNFEQSIERRKEEGFEFCGIGDIFIDGSKLGEEVSLENDSSIKCWELNMNFSSFKCKNNYRYYYNKDHNFLRVRNQDGHLVLIIEEFRNGDYNISFNDYNILYGTYESECSNSLGILFDENPEEVYVNAEKFGGEDIDIRGTQRTMTLGVNLEKIETSNSNFEEFKDTYNNYYKYYARDHKLIIHYGQTFFQNNKFMAKPGNKLSIKEFRNGDFSIDFENLLNDRFSNVVLDLPVREVNFNEEFFLDYNKEVFVKIFDKNKKTKEYNYVELDLNKAKKGRYNIFIRKTDLVTYRETEERDLVLESKFLSKIYMPSNEKVCNYLVNTYFNNNFLEDEFNNYFEEVTGTKISDIKKEVEEYSIGKPATLNQLNLFLKAVNSNVEYVINNNCYGGVICQIGLDYFRGLDNFPEFLDIIYFYYKKNIELNKSEFVDYFEEIILGKDFDKIDYTILDTENYHKKSYFKLLKSFQKKDYIEILGLDIETENKELLIYCKENEYNETANFINKLTIDFIEESLEIRFKKYCFDFLTWYNQNYIITIGDKPGEMYTYLETLKGTKHFSFLNILKYAVGKSKSSDFLNEYLSGKTYLNYLILTNGNRLKLTFAEDIAIANAIKAEFPNHSNVTSFIDSMISENAIYKNTPKITAEKIRKLEEEEEGRKISEIQFAANERTENSEENVINTFDSFKTFNNLLT